MAEVLVRDLDEADLRRLEDRARSRGIALEDELRKVITEAARPSRQELIAEIARIRAMTPKVLQTDSADLIREDRDSR